MVRLAPGADQEQIAARIGAILQPYGNLASYPRSQQPSNAILQAKIDSIRTLANFLPAVFLGIAALIQFVMLGRMIRAQRTQIGVMKALGYGDLQIMLHYTGYALSIGLLGAVIGSGLGLVMATGISAVYAQYFNLPQAIGGFNSARLIDGFILSLGVAAIAGLWAARGVAAIRPAESLQAESPLSARRVFLEAWPWLWNRLDTIWRISLRTVNRNRMRSAVTLLGVTFAVSLIVVSFFASNTVDYMFSQYFNRELNYDYLLSFTRPVLQGELLNVTRIGGVYQVEPLFNLPVKFFMGGREQDSLIVGLPPQTTMQRIFSPSGHQLYLPPGGLFLDANTATKLGAMVGDEVQVETSLGLGPPRLATIRVVGISKQLIGSESFASLDQVNSILQESGLVSGAMLRVDPGRGSGIKAALGAMTNVADIQSRQQQREAYNSELSYVYSIVFIMGMFAFLLGFTIIYNASVISFAERRRELASLRVIGFTPQEISSLLLRENLLQTLLGIALGLPFGRYLANAYAAKASTDVFTFQAVIYPSTYIVAALGGVLFVYIAHRLSVRNVQSLDLVEVLKTRD